MTYEIANIDPANYSRSNPIDTDIFFKIKNLEEDSISDLTIVSVSETIFKNGVFGPEYSESEYVVVDDGINFIIQKNTDYEKGSSAVIKIFMSQRINYIYHISFTPGIPYLYYSNITQHETIKHPKKLRFEFGDHFEALDQGSLSIKLNGYSIIDSGVGQGNFEDYVVVAQNEFLEVTIDHPEFFKNDNYNLEYSISNVLGNKLYGKIKFDIKIDKVILPSIFPQTTFEGFHIGLDKIKDNGDGVSAFLKWNEFLSRLTKSEVFFSGICKRK